MARSHIRFQPRALGGRVLPAFGDPLLDRMRSESALADSCMRARGYRLRPLNPS